MLTGIELDACRLSYSVLMLSCIANLLLLQIAVLILYLNKCVF